MVLVSTKTNVIKPTFSYRQILLSQNVYSFDMLYIAKILLALKLRLSCDSHRVLYVHIFISLSLSLSLHVQRS